MLKGSGTFTDDDLFRLGVLLYIHLQHLHGGSRAWPGEAAVTLYPRSVARAYIVTGPTFGSPVCCTRSHHSKFTLKNRTRSIVCV